MSDDEAGDLRGRARGPRPDFNSTGELTRGDTGVSARERMRMSRGRTSTDSQSSTDGGGGGVASSTDRGRQNSMLRKNLLAKRQLERQDSQTGSASEEAGGGRGGPRSPSRRQMSLSRPDTDDNDSDEEEEENERNEKEEVDYDEYYKDLTTVAEASVHFPLQVLPKSSAEEGATQPLLVIPSGGGIRLPFEVPILNPVVRSTEADILSGKKLLGDEDGLINESPAPGESPRSPRSGGNSGTGERLLNTQTDGKLHGTASGEGSSTLNGSILEVDGLYVRASPVLAQILLSSADPVNAVGANSAISPSVDPTMDLARVTQRTLRDLHSEVGSQQVRQRWRQLVDGKGQGNSPRASAGGRRGKENLDATTADTSHPVTSQASLLRQLHGGPVLQVIENPVDERASVPVMPQTSHSVGGALGNWGPDATIKERLGPLSLSHDRRSGSRSILRLHVHQLCIRDHPLVCEEERMFTALKGSFAVYRSLVEQQTIAFLAQRVQVVVKELSRLSSLKLSLEERRVQWVAGGGEDDGRFDMEPTELVMMRGLYSDLVEAVPLLAELRASMDDLTCTLVDGWKDLKEERRVRGYSSTRASMTVRKVEHEQKRRGRGSDKNGGDSKQAERERDQQTEQGDDVWNDLLESLSRVSDLLPAVQASLIEEDMEVLAKEGAVLGMEDGEGIDTLALSRELRKAPKPSRPDRSGGGQSSDGSSSTSQAQSVSASRSQPATKEAALRGLKQRHQGLLKGILNAATELKKQRAILPEYVVRLTSEGTLTPASQVDATELQRRQLLETTKFLIRVKINGKCVTETDPYAVSHPALTVDVRRFFEFRVLHQPSSVYLDIVAVGTGILSSETFVASVGVPLPGQLESLNGAQGLNARANNNSSVHVYTPVAGWLGFDSSSPLPLSAGLASQYSEAAQTRAREEPVSGAVLVAAEYDVLTAEANMSRAGEFDGIDEVNLALLPPPSEGAEANATAWGSGYAMGGGLTSNKLLPSLASMDPNDPRNDILASRLQTDPVYGDRKVFHLYGHDFAVPFTEGGESYQNYMRFKDGPRSQLLKLREQKPHLFTEPVPISDEAIKSSELYRRILSQNTPANPLLNLDVGEQEDAVDVEKQSTAGSKLRSFLSRVRQSTVVQSRSGRKKKMTTASTVAETAYFPVHQEIDLENILPEKKRSLKPKTVARTPNSMHISSCDLLVQVVSARNVPLRHEADLEPGITGGVKEQAVRSRSPRKKNRSRSASAGGDSSGAESSGEEAEAEGYGGSGRNDPQISEALLDEKKLSVRKRACTCVEVRFQEHTESTLGIPGGAPLWKQSISLPFRSPNDDYTPAALGQVRDEVHFCLFDEVSEDDASRGGVMEGENAKRTERRFLGSFSLPFSTIYKEGRVEGVFRLNTPMFNFGYVPVGNIASPTSENNSLFEGDDVAVEGAVENGLFNGILQSLGIKPPSRTPPQEFGHFIHKNTAEELEYFASGDGSTYIKVMATLDPLLTTLPHMPMEITKSSLYSEDRPFGGYAAMWMRECAAVSAHTKDRGFRCFATNSEGQQVLMSRYLSPQQPPEGWGNTRSAIHLVSMFPYMSDLHSFEDDVDFWCNTKEAWEIGAGDEEEHACILYNYLCYFAYYGEVKGSGRDRRVVRRAERKMGQDRNLVGYPDEESIRAESVFLVVGKAVPEGETTWVMMRDPHVTSMDRSHPRNFLLINPCTGHVFSAVDPTCPLKEICTLVTPYNTWANIQYLAKPFETSFDLFNVDNWRPFFGSRLPPPAGGLSSIQQEIKYVPTSTGYCLEIETAVLAAVKNNIRRWRSKRHRSTTTFHPDGCSTMTDLLPKLEEYKRNGVGAGNNNNDLERIMEEAERKMTPILRTRSFRGCPINLPFTDVDDVVNQVKALCVHESKHPEVQFVVAVKVFPCVNEIVSLWIFLGTLEAHSGRSY